MSINLASMTDGQLKSLIQNYTTLADHARAMLRTIREQSKGTAHSADPALVKQYQDRKAWFDSNANRAKAVLAARKHDLAPDASTQWTRDNAPREERLSGAEKKKRKGAQRGLGARCKSKSGQGGICRDRRKGGPGEGRFEKGRCPGSAQIQCWVPKGEKLPIPGQDVRVRNGGGGRGGGRRRQPVTPPPSVASVDKVAVLPLAPSSEGLGTVAKAGGVIILGLLLGLGAKKLPALIAA